MKVSYFLSVFLSVVTSGGAFGQSRLPDEGFAWDLAIWPKVRVGVCWENPAGWQNEIELVRGAIERTWEANSDLDFVHLQTCDFPMDQLIRIRIHDGPWSCGGKQVAGPHVCGLGKYLNNRRNGMVLNFSFSNWGSPSCRLTARGFCIEAIAVHEFGHALGFAHEHNRDDRDPNCTLEPQGTDGNVKIGKYDTESVMNYCAGYRNKLSSGDITTVQAFYGRPTDTGSGSPPRGIFTILDNRLALIQNNGNVIILGDDVWGGPTRIEAGVNSLTIVQNSKLHIVDPRTGNYTWFRQPDFDPKIPAAFDDQNFYYFRNGRLVSFDVMTKVEKQISTTDWSLHGGVTGMTFLNGRLYVVQGSTLHSVSTKWDSYTVLGKPVWKGPIQIGSHNKLLYIVQGNKLHSVSPGDGKYKVITSADWPDTTGIGSDGDSLVIVQRKQLHFVDVETERYSIVSNTERYLGAGRLVIMDGK